MSGTYILVLAPNINDEEDIWGFNPFDNMSLKEILDEVSKLIDDACAGAPFGPNFEYYAPFHYFTASQDADELEVEKRTAIAEKVHKALIDFNVLDESKFPIQAKNASMIIQWFSSSDSKYKKVLYLKDETAQKFADVVIVPKFSINNESVLIMLLAYDCFGPNIQKLMDFYPRR